MFEAILTLSQSLEKKIQNIISVHARIDRINHRLQSVRNCPDRQAFYDSIQCIPTAIQNIHDKKSNIRLSANQQGRELNPSEQERMKQYDNKLKEYRALFSEKQIKIRNMKIETQALIEQDERSVRSSLQELNYCYLDYTAHFTAIICIVNLFQQRNIPAFAIEYHGTPSATHAIPLLSIKFFNNNESSSPSSSVAEENMYALSNNKK